MAEGLARRVFADLRGRFRSARDEIQARIEDPRKMLDPS